MFKSFSRKEDFLNHKHEHFELDDNLLSHKSS